MSDPKPRVTAQDEAAARVFLEMYLDDCDPQPADDLKALALFRAEARAETLEMAAKLVEEYGYKSNGVSAYEHIAAAIRRLSDE